MPNIVIGLCYILRLFYFFNREYLIHIAHPASLFEVNRFILID
jgi:hypothetical protein